MPGIVDDSVALADLDYDTIKAFVYDIRARDEWDKFALTTSGDGTVDASLGEECDPNQEPPIVLAYDENDAGDWTTQYYPDADDPNLEGNSPVYKAQRKVSWVPPDTLVDESGNTARTEYLAAGYYTCTSASFLVAYDGCGDGVPSNGPPEVSAFNQLTGMYSNQRNGVYRQSGDDGYEACDDGNNDDGDGCSGDCSTIEDGYECLKWGEPCTPKCGNGHVEGYITPQVDSDGNELTDGTGATLYEFVYELDENGDIREECDMGSLNSPNPLGSNDIDGDN